MSTKALGIGDLDRFMEWAISQGSAELNKDALFQAVAFVYRGVQLRAQTLSALPFEISRDDTVVDSSEDYQNKLGWLPDPVRTLSLLEQSLCVAGYSYWFIERNQIAIKNLNYWNPYHVEPVQDPKTGVLTGFERNVNGKIVKFDVEDVFYVWPPDYRVELGPPLGSPVTAAFKAAGVLDSVDEFVKAFFERGGINSMLISAKGMGKAAERKSLKEYLNKVFFRGNKTSHRMEVVNAETIKAEKIGAGIEDLDNNELTNERRESVVAALGVPMSLILSSSIAGMGGGGVATQDDLNFYKKTIEPEAKYIAGELNKYLFKPYGEYKINFLFDQLDVYQVDETKRALSFATYVQSDMKPEYAAVMLGLEIPTQEQVDAAMAGKEPFEEPQPVPEALQQANGEKEENDVVDEALAAERAKEKEELEKAADLDKWRKKAVQRFKEGKPEKALAFSSEHIPEELYQQIVYSLKSAQNLQQVEDVFDSLGEPDAEWLFQLKRANDLLEGQLATD
jgi:phage portal protein BeeE